MFLVLDPFPDLLDLSHFSYFILSQVGHQLLENVHFRTLFCQGTIILGYRKGSRRQTLPIITCPQNYG